jgi:hypothetical protein
MLALRTHKVLKTSTNTKLVTVAHARQADERLSCKAPECSRLERAATRGAQMTGVRLNVLCRASRHISACPPRAQLRRFRASTIRETHDACSIRCFANFCVACLEPTATVRSFEATVRSKGFGGPCPGGTLSAAADRSRRPCRLGKSQELSSGSGAAKYRALDVALSSSGSI